VVISVRDGLAVRRNSGDADVPANGLVTGEPARAGSDATNADLAIEVRGAQVTARVQSSTQVLRHALTLKPVPAPNV